MADFCITEVRYNKDKSHIKFVKVRERKQGENGIQIGSPRIVSRAFVADLIRLGKVSFQTNTKTNNGQWKKGAEVLLFGQEFLTTDRNKTERDNLGELPEF